MTMVMILTIMAISVLLILAGASRQDRKADEWARLELMLKPPDDDDGVTLLEEDDDADG